MVERKLSSLKTQPTMPTPFFPVLKPVLKVDNITKRFGGITAVNRVSFTVNEGSMIGIIGPNGAGKTTLFNIITGILRPDSGSVFLKGQDVTGLKPHQLVKLGLGRTFQTPRVFKEMSVLENMLVSTINRKMKREYAMKKAINLLRIVNLQDLSDSPAIELSVGQQKLLEIAMTLMLDVNVLLLDEPFAGVNPVIKEEIIGLLKRFQREGGTVILISHDLPSTMTSCEKVLAMCQGELIAQGTPEEIGKHPKVIESYLGA